MRVRTRVAELLRMLIGGSGEEDNESKRKEGVAQGLKVGYGSLRDLMVVAWVFQMSVFKSYSSNQHHDGCRYLEDMERFVRMLKKLGSQNKVVSVSA